MRARAARARASRRPQSTELSPAAAGTNEPSRATPGSGVFPGVRRIAVLRATALGDFIFALPALDALRAAYPAAEIVLLGRAWHRDLLTDRPGPVDRVIPLPEGAVGDEIVRLPPEEREAILDALRAESFDLAIQLHGGGRNSNPFVAALGAAHTVGSRTPDAPELERTVPYVYYQSEMDRGREIVALAGARTAPADPRLVVLPGDVTEAMTAGAPIGGAYAVLHPGASDPRRRWPRESFALLARRLGDRGLAVAITGTAEEAELTADVATALPPSVEVVDLAGRLSVRGLAGLLSQAAVVVSNDTGPLHLAHAVGARTVGIFWVGNLITAGPATRARHRPIVAWRLLCPVCGVDCTVGACEHRVSFVADIDVHEVVEAAGQLLDERGSVPAPTALVAGTEPDPAS